VADAAAELSIRHLLPLRPRAAPVPAFPKRLFRASIGFILIALVFGLFGLASSQPTTNSPSGHVTVNAHALTGGSVPLNLERDIPIVVHHRPRVGGHLTAQVVLTFAGVDVVHSTVVPLVHRDGAWRGLVDAGDGRYVVGGSVVGSLRLSGTRGVVTDAFPAAVSRSPFATFLGLFGVVLLLLVAAFARSFVGDLCGGHRRRQRPLMAGVVLVGLLTGVVWGFLGWMLGLSLPTFWGFAVPAAFGAVAGLLGALAAVQVGQANRAHRQPTRLMLVARRSDPLSSGPVAAGSGV
jgi:hypothetical protein